MYSRPSDKQNRDIRIPHNYSGSIFNQHRNPPPEPPVNDEHKDRIYEAMQEPEPQKCEDDQPCESPKEQERHSLLSPIGALGTEELLLIALALIIFQSGKEPELALILLALLFIN